MLKSDLFIKYQQKMFVNVRSFMFQLCGLSTLVFLFLVGHLAWSQPLPQALPEEVGINVQKLKEAAYKVDKLIEMEEIAGAVLMVAKNGRIVQHKALGYSDLETERPMLKDDLFRIYSMTKPVTSVAIMILVERGKIQLDDPVSNYIPEMKGLLLYGQKKGSSSPKSMTIRDLLRHTSGLTYGFFSNTAVDRKYMRDHPLFSMDNDQFIQKLSRLPLLHQPGTTYHYSVSTDVLGAVVERVSGMKLGAFFKKEIFKPLQMGDTHFVIDNEKVDRFTTSYNQNLKVEDAYNASEFANPNRMESGGGGLISTANDYMRFSLMLLNKGILYGNRILQPKTVDMMTRNQLPKGVYADGYSGFGLGFRVQIADWGSNGHLDEYGWSGAASTHFWISPRDQLVVIVLSQRQPFSNKLQEMLKPVYYDALRR